MASITQAELNTGSPFRQAARSGSGVNNAQSPGQKQKAGGPGGRRGGGGGAGDVQSEVSAVDSLIGQLPANLQGAYQSSLQSIMNERGGDKRGSLQSLQSAIQDALDMLNAENGEENNDNLPETGGGTEGNPSLAQAFRGGKPGGGSAGMPPGVLAMAGKTAALSAPPPAFMRLSARA